LLLVLAGVIIFSGLAGKAIMEDDIIASQGWLVQIPIYTVATYGLYLRILYRSNNDFLNLNKNALVTAGTGLITLPLVYLFKFSGLAARSFVQNIVNTIVYSINAPYKVKAQFNKNGLVDLARVSFPLQLPAFLDSHLLRVTISLVILKLLGEKELGVYTMALMLQGFLLVFSQSLNQIITTKLMLKYGSNDDIKKTFKYIIKPILLVTFIGLLIVIVFNSVIQPLITLYLPKYVASIAIVQILAFEVVLALVRNPFTLFISSLMYKEMIIVRVIKVILTLLLLCLFHNTLVQIAMIVMLANFLNVIAGYLLLYYKMKTSVSV